MPTTEWLTKHLTKCALIEECEKRNLSTKGPKEELAKRLATDTGQTSKTLTLWETADEHDEFCSNDGTNNKSKDGFVCNNDDNDDNDEAVGGERLSKTAGAGKNDGRNQNDGDCFTHDGPKSSKLSRTSQSPKAATTTTGRKPIKKQNYDEYDDYNDEDDKSDDDDDEDDDENMSSSRLSDRRRHQLPHEVRLFNFRDIEGSIENFSGGKSQDIKLWLSDFEDYAEMAGWTPQVKIIACRKLLIGTARNFIFAERSVTSWLQLKKMLMKEFGKTINAAEIHRRLAGRTKKNDESYLDYVYEMQRIGKMGDFEDSAICEYICDGIPGDAMEKVNLYEADTIQQLKRKLERFEKQREKAQKNKPKAQDDKKFEKKDGETREVRCYNCGKLGHKSDTCPDKERGRKCFNCGEFGHNSSDCSKQSNDEKGKKIINKFEKKKDVSVNVLHAENKKDFHVDVRIGNKDVSTFVDTGSDICVIREDLWKKICSPEMKIKTSTMRIRGFGGSVADSRGMILLEFLVDGHKYQHSFHVATSTAMKYQLLLGKDFLSTVKYHIDCGIVSILPLRSPEEIENVGECGPSMDKDEKLGDSGTIVTRCEEVPHEDEEWLLQIEGGEDELDCPIACRSEIEGLIENYNPQVPENVEVTTMIKLHDDTPVVSRPRRASRKKKCIEEQIQKCHFLKRRFTNGFARIAKPLTELLKVRAHDDFVTEEDILYKMKDDQGQSIPEAMKADIVRQCHSAGHIGVMKMKNKWMQQYFITKLDEEARQGSFSDHCATNYVELHHITTGVLRGNGQMKRIRRIIIPMLAKLAIEKPDEWFKFVGRTQRFIDSSFQRSIQMTPFELVTGVKLRCAEGKQLMEISDEEYRNESNEQWCELREAAKQQILKIQDENRKGFDSKRKLAIEYNVEDIVVIKRTRFGGGLKLKPKFLGPYRVKRKDFLNNVRYKVRRLDDGDGPEATTSAADFMKFWVVTRRSDRVRSGRVGN